jgi:hypothetical protein
MLKTYRIPTYLVVSMSIFTVFLVFSCKPQPAVEQPAASSRGDFRAMLQSADLASHRIVKENGTYNVRVSPGTEAEAVTYLKEIKGAAHLKSFAGDFLDPNTNQPTSNLDALLRYVGQDSSVTAAQLEELSSAELVVKGYQTTRFFSPKIVNVHEPIDATKNYGWRKVVRLEIRDGSGAKADGMKALWVLFNHFSETPSFPASKAGAIQAILQRTNGDTNGFPVYFFVYTPYPSYTIDLFLKASFDAIGGDPEKKYYLPRACSQCHGSETDMKKVKINYLDTDHWFDRVQSGDDFAAVPKANVLPDGGEPGSSNFNNAFQAIRSLNTEIRDQNAAVGGDSDANFQLRAVSKWLALHAAASSHMPPFSRSITAPGWQEAAEPDRELLPLLNRYCFRCHSSFAYHVFDRPAVKRLAGYMKALVQGGSMPQDRRLDEATKAKLIGLLGTLAGP